MDQFFCADCIDNGAISFFRISRMFGMARRWLTVPSKKA